jgi:hypothetical protein
VVEVVLDNREHTAEASARNIAKSGATAYSFRLVFVAILGITLLFVGALLYVLYRDVSDGGIFTSSGGIVTFVGVVLPVLGAVVASYFGIKAGSDARDKAAQVAQEGASKPVAVSMGGDGSSDITTAAAHRAEDAARQAVEAKHRVDETEEPWKAQEVEVAERAATVARLAAEQARLTAEVEAALRTSEVEVAQKAAEEASRAAERARQALRATESQP